jgi:hypothetical protein
LTIEPLKWLTVGATVALLDYLWGVYIKSIAQRKVKTAMATSVIIYVGGASVTLSYIDNPVLLVPAAIGAAIGTWFAVD